MKKAFGIILFIAFWIVIVMFLMNKNDSTPDQSSNYQDREGQYIEGGGGHPLWNN